jgi:hypothetical protein
MRNNIIAIIVISFVAVGGLWGIGNLLKSPERTNLQKAGGLLLLAQDNFFNKTNPDLYAIANVPEKIVILNKDFVRHDFKIPQLNVDTGYLSAEQDFTTAIASKKAGIFEYYCSLHPETMRGNVIVKER